MGMARRPNTAVPADAPGAHSARRGERRASKRAFGGSMRRAVAASIGASILAVACVCVTTSLIAQNRSPRLALRTWPFNGNANAALAERYLERGNLNLASAAALRALDTEPTSARAARVLGFVADIGGDPDRAIAWMQLSQRLSRRDLGTTLWLNELSIKQNNIDGALRQFDVALRTSRDAPQILFPILSQALSEEEIAHRALPLFRTDPAWLKAFFQFAFSAGDSDRNLASIVNHLDSQNSGATMDMRRGFVLRLVERGGYETALSVYEVAADGDPLRAAIRSATFRSIGRFQPFDWEVLDSDHFMARPQAAGGLEFSFETGAGGTIARQLLFLKPGQYRLSSQLRLNSPSIAARPHWKVACAPSQRSLGETVPVAGSGNAVSITVPRGRDCSFQWLTLEVPRVAAAERVDGVVDSVLVALVD